MDGVGSGEYILLKYAPVFKLRYTADGDLILGCTIGCQFCYYRMIDGTAPYIGTGELRRLATPEEMALFVEGSRLVRDADLLILGARGDASMYPDEIVDTAEALRGLGTRILCLRRAVYGRDVAEHLASIDNIFYGTTITPHARETGSPVDEEAQLTGLEKCIEAGGDPGRISVEVGPVTPKNIVAVPHILRRLAEMGFTSFIYRGISLGAGGISEEKIVERLRATGFLYRPAPEKREYFYILKNHLEGWMEEAILGMAEEYGLRAYRHTGIFYASEWGVKVPLNRRNRVRREMMRFARPTTPRRIWRTLEEYGYRPTDVVESGDGVYRVSTDKPLTEDVAMRVGAIHGVAIISEKYLHSPDVGMLRFYLENGLIDTRHIRYGDLIRGEAGWM